MEPLSLAAGAVGVLVPYLAKAGDFIAGKVGETVWNAVSTKARSLYDTIRDRLQGNPYAVRTLARLEEKPEDEGRQMAMQALLGEFLAEDSDFRGLVGEVLAEAKQAGADSVIQVFGSGAAATHGGVAAGQGGYAAGGDITIRLPSRGQRGSPSRTTS